MSHFISPSTPLSLPIAPSTARLLATLHGHHKAITDIKYSNEGDRLLTASQKDGVVRIWSWGTETSRNNDGISIEQVRQIYLRMAPPQSHEASPTTSSSSSYRRRRSSTVAKTSMQVNCDMATWTSDDSKVITSQCCLTSPNSTDIVLGSQVIYVWDSRNGHCLLGFPSAHEKSCSVVIPHPIDSSIIVSAGADGVANVWSLRTGQCLFTHHNKRKNLAAETPAEREKQSGFLDGSISPDGLNLVLTDDLGSVTIIDTMTPIGEGGNSRMASTYPPLWMKEQYFANDYYELFYDTNGYCIDRGSRQPPHLAPTAARCNHTGSPYDSIIQDAFSPLFGPRPLCEEVTRNIRDELRDKSFHVRKQDGVLTRNVENTRMLIEAYPTAVAHLTNTAYISNHIKSKVPPQETESRQQQQQQTNNQSHRQLSNRYRWIGYDEILQEDDGDNAVSEDDENYYGHVNDDGDSDASPRRVRRRNGSNTSRSQRRNNRNNNRNNSRRVVERSFEEVINAEPTRMSARQSSRRNDPQMYDGDDSDDSAFEELLSTNTTPSGKYLSDYTVLGHTFKLPSGSQIKRKFVSRLDCVGGYIGKRMYAPQVGDSVVYIPRAHSETLLNFPICNSSSIGAPWKSWQTNSPWPVIQCEVKAIRYRFPYTGSFGRNCK